MSIGMFQSPPPVPRQHRAGIEGGGRDSSAIRGKLTFFVSQIAWDSEVWIAGDPDHMIHFNAERFLGPYPDVMPTK